MSSSPTIIVLAAGRGSRFGDSRHKLEQRFGHTTVLGTVLETVASTGLPMVVVTTPALAGLVVDTVAAKDVVLLAQKDLGEGFGMGRSISRGVLARPDSQGWLVMPGDMPLVRGETLRAVAQALKEHTVAYPQHLGRRGHPVGFASELYSELAQLSGDEGARRVMARYASHGIDVDDAGVLMDIDTPDDLHLARAYQAADADKPSRLAN
jgi:molybdenum cofactor cytidylyltransferase